MSQPDLIDELRSARPVAPAELRARVRAVAAGSEVPPRARFTWRRAGFALVPALAALVVTAVVLGHRGGDRTAVTNQPAVDVGGGSKTPAAAPERAHVVYGRAAQAYASGALKLGAAVPAPTPGRVVRYSTYLELQLRTANAVARAAQRALRMARALGGHPASVRVDTSRRSGDADLVLRVPRAHVQEAVARLSTLGTIAGEHVSIQDLEAGLDTDARTIARLQHLIRTTLLLPQTDKTRRTIAAATARIVRLQRAGTSTRRDAHFASVELQMHTPPARNRAHHTGHGPLHGLGVAFRWIGIGAVYALALGVPLLLLGALVWLVGRTVRRRREDALLSSP